MFKEFLFAFLATLGFGVLFNIKEKKLLFSAIGGGLSWTIFSILLNNNLSLIYSTFIAAICVSIYSEIMARLFKTPVTIFVVPSIIPLVPGGSLYYTMIESINGKYQAAFSKAIETFQLAAVIAVAIVLISSLTRIVNYKKNKPI
ncbi:MAG: threonine/serine exporter family protein [Clostridiaceae bacterium]